VDKQVKKRTQIIRRAFNQSFMDENGNILVMKVIAVAGQIMVLANTGIYFFEMLKLPETLLVCLGFIIAPDIVKKALNMKYGGNGAPAK